MNKQYELPESYPDQIMMIQKLGRLQGLIDAVIECALPDDLNVDPADHRFADFCLTRAMNLAKQIMDATEDKNNGQTK